MLDPTREAGWTCADCRETLGYRPGLDRSATHVKVRSILQDLHSGNLVYVSGNTMGDIVVHEVANLCRDTDTYDQWSIIGYLVGHPDMDHADYWQREAEQWLLEHDSEQEEQSGGVT
jgi:hypothetical protein